MEQKAKVALKLADHGYVIETGEIVIEGDARTLQQKGVDLNQGHSCRNRRKRIY